MMLVSVLLTAALNGVAGARPRRRVAWRTGARGRRRRAAAVALMQVATPPHVRRRDPAPRRALQQVAWTAAAHQRSRLSTRHSLPMELALIGRVCASYKPRRVAGDLRAGRRSGAVKRIAMSVTSPDSAISRTHARATRG